jgi:RimJ/RimL family protein N-acetyltransferase
MAAIWIVEDEGANVGLVMIDRHDRQGLPRLTLGLRRGARGRGIGRRALALVCEQWQRPVIAEVSAANTAAVRSLEAAGFERTGERTASSATGTPELRCTYLWSP